MSDQKDNLSDGETKMTKVTDLGNGVTSETVIKPSQSNKGRTQYTPIACGFRSIEGEERARITAFMAEKTTEGQNVSQSYKEEMQKSWDNCQILINTRPNGQHTVLMFGHYEFINKAEKMTYGFNYLMLEMNAEMTDFVESCFMNDVN